MAAGGGVEEKEEQEEVGVRAIAVCEEQRLCREAAERGRHLYSEERGGTPALQCKCPDCCNPIDNSAVEKTEEGGGGGAGMIDEECKSNEVHTRAVCA